MPQFNLSLEGVGIFFHHMNTIETDLSLLPLNKWFAIQVKQHVAALRSKVL